MICFSFCAFVVAFVVLYLLGIVCDRLLLLDTVFELVFVCGGCCCLVLNNRLMHVFVVHYGSWRLFSCVSGYTCFRPPLSFASHL